MSELREQVEHGIHARGLLRRGEKVLVAVSGGVDSMVLLHVLHALSKKHRWQLAVAHLNHQLRGRSSDADERLVVKAAKKLGVRVVVGRAEVKKIAAAGKLSVEMAARKARHEFLAKTAAQLKISKVALAHHADDQVELFFLRLLRGSGSEGLAGMKWRGPSPANPKIQLARPLLGQSKDALRDYARVEKILFREDESNEWLDIRRNRIRNELLPLLRRKYQPEVRKMVLRLMEILREESELVNHVVEEWMEKGGAFAKWPVAVQRRRIQAQLIGRGIPVDFALVERLRILPGKLFTIVAGMEVRRNEKGKLEFRESNIFNQHHLTQALFPVSRRRGGEKSRISEYEVTVSRDGNDKNSAADSDELEVKLDGKKGTITFGAAEILWAVHPLKTFRVPKPQVAKEAFDADKVGGRITLRHWRAGDRFQPIGMPKPVKLQDLFVNLKIPREKRHDLVVAVSEGNGIFWVESLRISERFKLTPQTSRRLEWRWSSQKNRRLRVSTHHVTLAQRKNV